LKVFDNKWLVFIHCLLWELKEVDEWDFHRIIYKLNKEGIIPINSWVWFGNSPRSAEVDAAIGLFSLYRIIELDGEKIRVIKSPRKCSLDDHVLDIARSVLKEKTS